MSTSGKYVLPEIPEDLRGVIKEWDGVGIAPAFFADPDYFEELTGLKVHPKAFDQAPQGCRILVVREDVPEEYGSIHLPDSYRATETMGIGWILAVGALANADVPLPYGPIVDHPARLICQKITMSQTIGGCIRLDIRDKDYKSAIVIMTTRDIWTFDTDPTKKIGEVIE